MHYKAALQCVENHKPFICEKPFFVNSEEARKLLKFAEKEKVLAMEGMWSRTLPAVRKAKEWVDEGGIGELRLMRADFGFPASYNEESKIDRLWNANLAGGSFWDAGVYPYEYFTFFAGERPESISGSVYWEHGVDASTAFTLKFPCGAVADGKTSIVSQTDFNARISGTKGFIIQNEYWRAQDCTLYDNEGNVVETFEKTFDEGFVFELEHFMSLVKEGATESPLISHVYTLDFTLRAEDLLRMNS